MSNTTSSVDNKINDCKELLKEWKGWFPSSSSEVQNVRASKPIAMMANRKLGVALVAQHGRLKPPTKEWVGVDLSGEALKAGLDKLASEKGIGDSLKSDKDDDNIIFQFVKLPEKVDLEDLSLGLGNLVNTSDRKCAMKVGAYRKTLAEAIYPDVNDLISQQTNST